MESLCRDQLHALLRPLREVAIMSGALLPGDARPNAVEAAIEMEEELERAMKALPGSSLAFEEFYSDAEGIELAAAANVAAPKDVQDVGQDILLQLQELDLKERKKAQQKGRRKARDVAKREKRFREEKRKVDNSVSDVKVRDGISGRPISQVVLIGGATRMPAIGRLVAALTGVVPRRTVNPDEAVALGCAVHVGVLDGDESLRGMTVLNPMQAAIMRAVAEQQGLLTDDFDDDDFDSAEFF
jgi:hypothetical protein